MNLKFHRFAAFILLSSSTSALFAGDALRGISKKLISDIQSRTPVLLGVWNFPYARNRVSTGSHLVSERLVTYLVQDGARVIERRLLEKILEERKLRETGLLTPDMIKDVGGILGVDAIVTGVLNDLSETSTEVMARVIKVQTGEILAAATAIIDRLWLDPPRLPRAAQPRSAMPLVLPPVSSQEAESVGRIQDDVLRLPAKRQHYYPVTIPFVIPAPAKAMKGSVSP